MPKFLVKKQTSESPAEAYKKVKNWLSSDQELKKLDPGYKCEFNDSALAGTAKGKMFKAELVVKSSGAGSEIEIAVDLPMTLALVKGMVEKTITKKLDATLS